MSGQKMLLQEHRLTRAAKYAKNQKYFRDQLDILDIESTYNTYNQGEVSEYKRRKVNYDLHNNYLNLKDFEYVCKPFGAEAGELPAKMVNRDIVSRKIKALEGMEMKRAFPYKVVATNREATTRKEQEQFGRINQYVIDQILAPIKEQIALKHEEELRGEQLTQERQAQIQQEMQAEFQSQTPDKVKRYMERDHQDPAEVLAQQLLNYITQKEDLKMKFNKGWKHFLLSAYEVYWVGIIKNKPVCKVVNPIRFSFDKNPDEDFIEDGEWAVAEYRMTPSQVVNSFDLTPTEIDKIYSKAESYAARSEEHSFDFSDSADISDDNEGTIKVIHGNWKGLRRLAFLSYIDQDGIEQEELVDESYELNVEAGDIEITYEWYAESYEGYKIGNDIYTGMREVPGQFRDFDNLDECKLSYKGAVCDDLNSAPTSVMDRLKVFQYYYNIVMYRLELLLASDKGKKIMMNINAIPNSAGIDIKEWQYFFESSPFVWYNPNEEGVEYGDVNTMAKVLDMSMVSDIQKYIEFAQYLKRECGESVGITEAIEGQIGQYASNSTNQANLQGASNILEPYFALHNMVKKNVLQSMIDVTKVAYSENPPETLAFILDDLSTQLIQVDNELLQSSTVGLYISDSARAEEARETMKQLAHAAMQNQKIEMSDMISIIRQEGVQEAEEALKVSENSRNEREQKLATANSEAMAAENEKQHQRAIELKGVDHKNKLEEINVKGKLDLQKQVVLSAGFNEDKDADNDGQLDVLEIARDGLDANLKVRKQDLEEKKFEHTVKKDAEAQKMEKQKLKDKTYS